MRTQVAVILATAVLACAPARSFAQSTLLLLDSSPASWALNFPYFRQFIAERQGETELSEQLELGITAQWLAKNAITNNRVWASIGAYDIHESLSRIQAPTLIVHGTFSVISMQGAEAIAARIPRSRLVALQDVGHFPYIEAPLAFSTAVRTFVWPR